MSPEKPSGYPVTPAIHALRAAKVPFEPHLYKYEEKGGTSVSSRELGVDEHTVVKTLVMETSEKDPLIVLMHGDRQVSLKELARQMKVKAVSPCKPDVANRHSGYQVGGTSPFGTRKKLPVYVEQTIFDLQQIYINGGGKGFLVSLDPKWLRQLLDAQPVSVAITSEG